MQSIKWNLELLLSQNSFLSKNFEFQEGFFFLYAMYVEFDWNLIKESAGITI